MKSAGPIVITGFMGCGKTEVARALADLLHLKMVDLDEMIAAQEGRTAAQLIREEGESAFRAIETNALHKLLESGEAGVIALGGGAWITEENRELIKRHGGSSVWLDVSFEICWKRIEAAAEDRPLGRTREQAEHLYQLREPVYRLAKIRVEFVADEPLENVVARLAASLRD
jgi:shikimate kinase